MDNVIGRIVASFFLLMTAVDMTYPCLEKLEAAGLIPDHFQDAFGSPDFNSDRSSADSSRPRETNPVDDDCFCCRGDVLVEPYYAVASTISREGMEGTSLLPTELLLPPALLAPLPRIHWPPGFVQPSKAGFTTLPARPHPQEAVLAGNLLSPPGGRAFLPGPPLAAIAS